MKEGEKVFFPPSSAVTVIVKTKSTAVYHGLYSY